MKTKETNKNTNNLLGGELDNMENITKEGPISRSINKKISRRTFIKAAAVAGGAVAVSGALNFASAADYGERSPDTLSGAGVVYKRSGCWGCAFGCGIQVRVNTVAGVDIASKIDGNPYDTVTNDLAPAGTEVEPTDVATPVASPGKLCPKGQAMLKELYDPYRVQTPLKRAGKRGEGKWTAISWATAIEEITNGGTLPQNTGVGTVAFDGLKQIKAGTFTPDSTLANTATAGSYAGQQIIWTDGRNQQGTQARFLDRLGASRYDHSSVCNGSWKASWGKTLGSYVHRPDLQTSIAGKKADYIIYVGCNPFEADQALNYTGRKLTDRLADSAKLIVLDPRLSVTASKANTWGSGSQWIRIKQGGDGIFALAMMKRWFASGAIDSANAYLQRTKVPADNSFKNYSNAAYLVELATGSYPFGKISTNVVNSGGSVVAGSSVETAQLDPAGYPDATYQGTVYQLLKARVAGLSWADIHTATNLGANAAATQTIIEDIADDFWAATAPVAMSYRGTIQTSNGYYTNQAWAMINILRDRVDRPGGLVLQENGFGLSSVLSAGSAPPSIITKYDRSVGFPGAYALQTADQTLGADRVLVGNVTAATGSTLKLNSILKIGSVVSDSADRTAIGGSYNVNVLKTADQTLTSDVVLTGIVTAATGSTLKLDSILKIGSIVSDSADRTAIGGSYTTPTPTRAWFYAAYSGAQQEIFPGESIGYPWRIKAHIMYIHNPAYTHNPSSDVIEAMKKADGTGYYVPLYVNLTTSMNETAELCDYVLPSSTWGERWTTPTSGYGGPLAQRGTLRRPIVGRYDKISVSGGTNDNGGSRDTWWYSGAYSSIDGMTDNTKSGVSSISVSSVSDLADKINGPQQMEDILILMGKRLKELGDTTNLANFGYEGQSAGVHYDSSYDHFAAAAKGSSILGGTANEPGTTETLKAAVDAVDADISITAADAAIALDFAGKPWRKYLWMGGRRKNADGSAYNANLHQDATLEYVANRHSQTVKNLWIGYWEGKKRNYIDGGYINQMPPASLDLAKTAVSVNGTDVNASDETALYPYGIAQNKLAQHAQSRTSQNEWLRELVPKNYVTMAAADAATEGLVDGDTVKLEARFSLNTDGVGDKASVTGELRTSDTLIPGTIYIPHHFGRWAAGASQFKVDSATPNSTNGLTTAATAPDSQGNFTGGTRGADFDGEMSLSSGTAVSPITRRDPYNEGKGGGAITDIGGSPIQYNTKVKITKV